MDDWQRILIGDDRSWTFLLETAGRSAFMCVVLLLLFKLTGKKEVRQFSVLELIVIIGLGSAAGDPMFYRDVPLLPAVVAILVVLLLYRLLNQWTNRVPRMGDWVEGTVVKVLDKGVVDRAALDKEGLSLEEFFGDLRTHHVEHLGQVKAAHVEVDGDLSVFFQADEDVLPGLPIHVGWAQELRPVALWPDGPLSCGTCGVTQKTAPLGKCAKCGSDGWLPSVSFKRIS